MKILFLWSWRAHIHCVNTRSKPIGPLRISERTGTTNAVIFMATLRPAFALYQLCVCVCGIGFHLRPFLESVLCNCKRCFCVLQSFILSIGIGIRLKHPDFADGLVHFESGFSVFGSSYCSVILLRFFLKN